jgi:hypothetical protein
MWLVFIHPFTCFCILIHGKKRLSLFLFPNAELKKIIYPNYNVATVIQGTYLVDALNVAWSDPYFSGQTAFSNSVPQLLNMNVTFNASRPAGVRIVQVLMRNPESGEWSPVDPFEKYYICLPK